MHVWLSGIQALPAPLTEGKLIFLARTFYLNRDKVNISTGSRNVLLILRELFSPSYILLYYGVSSFRAKQGVSLGLYMSGICPFLCTGQICSRQVLHLISFLATIE
jgi:hypothetical protein